MGIFVLIVIGAGIIISAKVLGGKHDTPSALSYTVIDDKPYNQPSASNDMQYDKTALRCEQGKGLIGYYHLEDWFNDNFTEDEFAYIKEKLSHTMMNPDQLNKGVLSYSSQTASKFLDSLAYNFNTKKRYSHCYKIPQKIRRIN